MPNDPWNPLERGLARRRTLQSTGPRFHALWRFIRVLVPSSLRVCFEGHPSLDGQMWFAERRLLHKVVRAHRPRTCAEVGTWRGGGSTFFTALALKENGTGMVHTWETDRDLYETARAAYDRHLPELAAHVSFQLGDYRDGPVLPDVNCLMLDGPEDAQSTLDQLRFFESKMRPGSVLLAHDWHTEKARLVRPLLADDARFRIVARVDPPISVGFVVAVKAS